MKSEEQKIRHNEYCRKWRMKHVEAVRKSKKKYYDSHWEKCRKTQKAYHLAHLEKSREYVKRWRAAHPRVYIAEHRAQRAIPLKEVCEVCGGEAKHRHHSDYNKPLEVIHVCPRCHKGLSHKGEIG